MSSDLVNFEHSSGIARLTLNRPETRNALNENLIRELLRQLEGNCSDPKIRVVILQAAGSCFCSGADLHNMRHMCDMDFEQNLADTRRLADLLYSLHTLPKPTIASVQGAAIGGGMGLVCCCDLVIAAADAVFRLSEVRLGLVPAIISPYLVQALGFRTAKRLMLTAEPVDAQQALKWGLADDVIPTEQLHRRTQQLAERFLKGAPGALASSKKMVNELADRVFDEAIRTLTAHTLAERRSSEEARAGVQSFLNKEQPSWLPDISL